MKESFIYLLNPRKLFSAIILELKFIKKYIESAFKGNLQRRKYKNLSSFCIFVGYPRSGHSLVSALLDAHPNIVMAMELDVLGHLGKGFRRYQLFYLLRKFAYNFKKIRNNIWTGYSYKIPNGWQGRHKVIKIIGDKQGGRTSLRLMENPNLLENLQNTVKVPLKIIHVVRNPFDMITTAMFRKHSYEKLPPPTSLELLPLIHSYIQRAKVIQELKQENKYPIFELHHEKLIENPKYHIENLLDFLEVEKNDEYIDSCASIINNSPNLSRNRIKWPDNLISYLEEELKKYPFFMNYTYKD